MSLTRSKAFPYAVALLPIGLFFAMLYGFTPNIFWLDDIEAVLLLHNWNLSPDWQQRFQMVWFPNNEHRIVILKICVLLLSVFGGVINFKWLSILTYLYLIPLFHLFWKVIPAPNSKKIYFFLPIPFLFLNLQCSSAIFWFILTFQRNLVIGFGLIGIYYLVKGKRTGTLLGILSIFLACMSNSDGLLFMLIASFVFVLKRDWKALGYWVLGSGVFMSLFFIKNPASNLIAQGLTYFFAHPLESPQAFFILLGSFIDFWEGDSYPFRLIITFWAGIVVFISIAVGLWFGFQRFMIPFYKQPIHALDKPTRSAADIYLFLVLAFIYCLCNVAMLSILRTQNGLFSFLIGNHKIFSLLAITLLYLLWLLLKPTKVYLYSSLAFAIIFWTVSIISYQPRVKAWYEQRVAGLYNLTTNHYGLGFGIKDDKQFDITAKINALITGSSYFPPNYLKKLLALSTWPTQKEGEKFDITGQKNGVFHLQIDESPLLRHEYYGVLVSEKGVAHPTEGQYRVFTNYPHLAWFSEVVVSYKFQVANMPPGKYRFYLADANAQKMWQSNYYLVIQ
jgi:hypothetical protein